MAETNLSTPFQSPFTTGQRPQDANMPAQPLLPPAYPQTYSAFTHDNSYSNLNSPFESLFPEPPPAPFQYFHQNRYYHSFALNGGTRMPGYYPPPSTSMYQYAATRAPPPPSRALPNHPHGPHTPAAPHAGAVGLPDNGNLLPIMEPPVPRGSQPYINPYSSHPPIAGVSSPPGRRHSSIMPAAPAPHSQYFTSSGMQPAVNNVGSVENISAGNSGQPHQITSPPNRRTSYDGAHHQHSSGASATPERRALAILNAQNRRSNRSISPRASNRRSFDRYSTDLSQSRTSSDAEEAAARAAPFNRARHRLREVRPRYFGHVDVNIPTPRQMQDLKAKLKRMLPSELPEGASTTCDICQKDYCAKHVRPSEEEEIVIELSCGHRFGEFCILEWFDTCKTHKNKVTCPMCRKVLLEPIRHTPAFLHALSGFAANSVVFSSPSPPPFEQLFVNELRGDFAQM